MFLGVQAVYTFPKKIVEFLPIFQLFTWGKMITNFLLALHAVEI